MIQALNQTASTQRSVIDENAGRVGGEAVRAHAEPDQDLPRLEATKASNCTILNNVAAENKCTVSLFEQHTDKGEALEII